MILWSLEDRNTGVILDTGLNNRQEARSIKKQRKKNGHDAVIVRAEYKLVSETTVR